MRFTTELAVQLLPRHLVLVVEERVFKCLLSIDALVRVLLK